MEAGGMKSESKLILGARSSRKFLIRALRSRDEARISASYVPAEAVIERLEQILKRAKLSKASS